MGGTRYRCVSEQAIWGFHVLRSRGDSIRFMDEDMHHTQSVLCLAQARRHMGSGALIRAVTSICHGVPHAV